MIWMQVGERIEKLRQERKLTKAQFGRLIGLSVHDVEMVAKGRKVLSGDVIARICDRFGISADYIMFGTIDPYSDPATTAAVSGLSHEQLQIALDIIKKVAEFVNTNGGNEALIQEIASRHGARSGQVRSRA